jgi:hypothetical protein
MPRIRTIKPDFTSSPDVGRLSREARLFFLQLLCFVDDEGRCRYIKRTILGELFPYDKDVSERKIAKWVEECSKVQMILVYEVDGEQFLWIRNFGKHQCVNRKTESKLPPPPDSKQGLKLTEDSMSNHGAITEDSHKAHGGLTPRAKEMEMEMEKEMERESSTDTEEARAGGRKPAAPEGSLSGSLSGEGPGQGVPMTAGGKAILEVVLGEKAAPKGRGLRKPSGKAAASRGYTPDSVKADVVQAQIEALKAGRA